MQTGVLAVLILFYMIVWIVLQFKLFNFYFTSLMNFILRILFSGFLAGIIMASITLYFWPVTLVVFIVLGLVAFGRKKPAAGIALIIVGIILSVVGYNFKADMKKDKDSETTASQSYYNEDDEDSDSTSDETVSDDSSETKDSVDESEDEATDSQEYIFPDSDSEYIDTDEITSLSDEDLRIAINEIYARHGYHFKSAELQNYFNSTDWYKDDDITDQSEISSELNKYEKENLKNMTNERSARQ